jgi:hypothetical protein
MFNVTVTYVNDMGAKEILNEIITAIVTLKPEVQKGFGEYNFILLNQNISTVTDPLLIDYQIQNEENLIATNKNLEDVEKALENLMEPEMPVVLSKVSILKAGIRYSVMGCFIGVFLSVFGVCIAVMMNEKLSSDNDLQKRFSFKLLGNFSQIRAKSTFSGIMDWLDRLEGKEKMPDELVYEMLATKIYNFTDTCNSVFFTGMVGEEVLETLVIKLQEKLPELKLGFGVDITRKVSALRKLSEYDIVVLVEMREKSMYRDIEKEIEMVFDMKKNIIGYIMFPLGKK